MLVVTFVCFAWFSVPAEPETRLTVTATRTDAVIDPWPSESLAEDAPEVPECEWWDPSTVYTSQLCSPFSVSRLVRQTAPQATDRAVRCAAAADTECVLSPEVGLGLPVAWYYDAASDDGMRFIAAPRIVRASDARDVHVAAPVETDAVGRTMLNFFNNITIEYLGADAKAPRTETFTGAAAYCVQLLRHAFDEACWTALD